MNSTSPQVRFRRRASEAAFSLVEVLVAAGIVGVTFVSAYLCISQSVRVTELNRDDLRVTQILNEKMEMMRLYTWYQITNGPSIPDKFTNRFYTIGTNQSGLSYTGTVTFRIPTTDTNLDDFDDYGSLATCLRKVTVQIKWVTPGTKNLNSRRMSTLVASNGLQNYIYDH